MLKKLFQKLSRNQKGITGLETAIILIAFVVVASVFAYTVLSAGIFSSQKGKEAVYSGLQEAQSSMVPKGSLLAYSGAVGTDTTAVKFSFTVNNALPGQSVDLTPSYILDGTTGITPNTDKHVTFIKYVDDNQMLNDAAWTVKFIGKNNGDNLLESGEQAVITVWMFNYASSAYDLGEGPAGSPPDSFISDAAKELGVYSKFTIEVQAPSGAALSMQRSLPARLDATMDLN
jgi:flagellin FlaB